MADRYYSFNNGILRREMKRKAPFSKAPPFKRQKTSGNLAFQKNTVSVAPPEKKDVLGAIPIAAPFGTPAFAGPELLNGSTTGAGPGQHIGRKTAMKSLHVRYDIALMPTSVGGAVVRILIVYDKQTNKALPAITDVLIQDNFNSPMNLDNSDRFIILADKLCDPVSTQNNFNIAGTIYKKMGLDTMWDTTVNFGDVRDIKSGSIVAFVAQSGGVTVANIETTAVTRIRYIDN